MPWGLHEDCFKQVFGVSKITNFQDWQRKEIVSQPGLGEMPKPYLSSFFAGNYRKYEASLQGKKYIFKLGSENCPELAPVEYLCNHIGKKLNIPVPEPFALVKGDKELAFVTYNFTQEYPGHHNLVHLYHYLPAGEDKYNVENIVNVIGEQTQDQRSIRTFLEVLIYDALIGNHDRHGRNLALIETARGKVLSPIYDNISALGLESGNFLLADWNPAGKIAVKHTAEPVLKDYLIEIKRLGYWAEVNIFIRNFPEKEILKMISEAGYLSENMRSAVQKLFNKRVKELKDAS